MHISLKDIQAIHLPKQFDCTLFIEACQQKIINHFLLWQSFIPFKKCTQKTTLLSYYVISISKTILEESFIELQLLQELKTYYQNLTGSSFWFTVLKMNSCNSSCPVEKPMTNFWISKCMLGIWTVLTKHKTIATPIT